MNLKRYFLNLKIRLKLLIAFGSILLMSVVLVVIAINAINSILINKGITEKIDKISNEATIINSIAKDFYNIGYKSESFQVNGKSRFLTDLNQHYEEILSEIIILKSKEQYLSKDAMDLLNDLEDKIKSYINHFDELKQLLKERGFKDYGVEGELRAAIHEVEESSFPYDKATMLTLRRHEKDFFLRQDLKYLEKFNATIDAFKNQILSVEFENNQEQEAQQIFLLLDNYQKKFEYVVELEKQIGLSTTSGKIGQLNSINNELAPQVKNLVEQVKSQSGREINNAYLLLITVFGIQLVIGLVLVVFYSALLTKTIKEIRSAMVSLSNGKFPAKLEIKSKDELAQTKIALNQLVERIKTAAEFARNLGNGKLNSTYDQRFNNDVLAQAILSMQDELIKAEKEQKQSNWINQGLALFSDLLKNESEEIIVLGDKIITQLVNYLQINQGAVYILIEEENTKFLKRISTYAYSRKKFIEQRIEIGQGLVGQAVLEKEPILLTDVPNGFTSITSGLGEATPGCIYIVPLMVREEVVGVIELASFKFIEKYQRDFIIRVSENIANILINKRRNEVTQKLLTESQSKAEQLAAQEEELRQNSEEFQATQEDMVRQKREMENEMDQLKEELTRKNSIIKNLRTQKKLSNITSG